MSRGKEYLDKGTPEVLRNLDYMIRTAKRERDEAPSESYARDMAIHRIARYNKLLARFEIPTQSRYPRKEPVITLQEPTKH